jgi:hypothetical protein
MSSPYNHQREATKEFTLRNSPSEDGSWTVCIVEEGDRYGRDDCLTHDRPDPMVEFYDAPQDPEKFGRRGQFVARYYLSTLICTRAGLTLDCDIPAWTLDAAQMRTVREHFLIPFVRARFMPILGESPPNRVSETSSIPSNPGA